VSVSNIFRFAYWAVWFLIVPAVLAALAVWILSPPDVSAAVGPLASLRIIVREQPIPVAIVLFTFFEMLLWSQRHVLPWSAYVGVAGRVDVPSADRKDFERASALLEEAERIIGRHTAELERSLPSGEREILKDRLSQLREAMDLRPFESERFHESLSKADDAVEAYLSRWRKGELREYGESIAIAVAVALLLRAFVVEAFKIPSRSMVPTLAVGDHIFVNKFAYGPMIPGTHSRLLSRMPPSRGDVIVFQFPERPEQDFIKRTIAIPGDVLEAYDGRPAINGWPVPRCKVGAFSYQETESGYSSNHSGELFMEYLGKESYLTFFDQTSMSTVSRSSCKVDSDCQQQLSGSRCMEGYCAEYQGPYKVKPGEVWVMGDNRNNSHDSRGWFDGRGGGVPFDNIRGRALFVWMSFNQTNSIAWDRIGVSVMGRPKLPVNDEARLHDRVSECLKNRPSVELTTPPPAK